MKKFISIICAFAVLVSVCVFGAASASAAGYRRWTASKPNFEKSLFFADSRQNVTLPLYSESQGSYQWDLPSWSLPSGSVSSSAYAQSKSNLVNITLSPGDGVYFPGFKFNGWFGGASSNSIITVAFGMNVVTNSGASAAYVPISINSTTVNHGGSLYSVDLPSSTYTVSSDTVVRYFVFTIYFEFRNYSQSGLFSISYNPVFDVVLGDLGAYLSDEEQLALIRQGNALTEDNNRLQAETNQKLDEILHGGSYDQPDGSVINQYDSIESQLVGGQAAGLQQATNLFQNFPIASFVKGLGAWVQIVNVFTGQLPWLNLLLTVSLGLGIFAFLFSIGRVAVSASDRSSRRASRSSRKGRV